MNVELITIPSRIHINCKPTSNLQRRVKSDTKNVVSSDFVVLETV